MTGIKSIGYIIVFVRDMKKALSFYRDALGIPVKAESEHWTEFALQGTTLALHTNPDLAPAPAPSKDPSEKKNVNLEIVFGVENPISLRDKLAKSGINIAKPKMVHEAGDHVGVSCIVEDPDGNTLSIYGLVKKTDWDKLGL